MHTTCLSTPILSLLGLLAWHASSSSLIDFSKAIAIESTIPEPIAQGRAHPHKQAASSQEKGYPVEVSYKLTPTFSTKPSESFSGAHYLSKEKTVTEGVLATYSGSSDVTLDGVDYERVKAAINRTVGGRSPAVDVTIKQQYDSSPFTHDATSDVLLVAAAETTQISATAVANTSYQNALSPTASIEAQLVAQLVSPWPTTVGSTESTSAGSGSTTPIAQQRPQPLPMFGTPDSTGNSVPSEPLPSPINSGVFNTAVDENYVLGPGDIIEVTFFNVPEYNGQHRISTNGAINLPLIGRISVNGMTLNQASDTIADRYFYQLQNPIVSINVLQQRPLQIAIAGEITQPGLYTLSAEGTNYPRIFSVLQQAGGLTQAADLKHVRVRRQAADGTQSILTVNLLALLQDGDISQNIYLQDGDAILIASAFEVDRIALNELSISNLRANLDRPLNVAIVGAVTQPGPYQLGGEGAPVTAVQALQAAGGIIPSADLRDIQLRRRTRQGGEQVFNINLWEALRTGDLSQDVALQQGDTIIVPTAPEQSIEEITTLATSTLSTGSIQINIIGEVETPGNLDVRANTSFNQALLAAGGLNRRSRQEATLIRFNANGTVDRRTINVDLDQDIDPETNPILRPNDVIVVGRSARAAFDDNVGSFSRTFNLVWPFLFLF